VQCGCKKPRTALIDIERERLLTSTMNRLVAAVLFVLKIWDEVFVSRMSLGRVTGFCAIG
jgi:hypothetical protein